LKIGGIFTYFNHGLRRFTQISTDGSQRTEDRGRRMKLALPFDYTQGKLTALRAGFWIFSCFLWYGRG